MVALTDNEPYPFGAMKPEDVPSWVWDYYDQPVKKLEILFDEKSIKKHGSFQWKKLSTADNNKLKRKTDKQYKRALKKRQKKKNKPVATYEHRFDQYYMLWIKEEEKKISQTKQKFTIEDTTPYKKTSPLRTFKNQPSLQSNENQATQLKVPIDLNVAVANLTNNGHSSPKGTPRQSVVDSKLTVNIFRKLALLVLQATSATRKHPLPVFSLSQH
jgi:hypothetical protein